jgi:hypothetical protein
MKTVLQRSLRYIEKLNGFRSSQESAYYGLTEFSDLSEDEFLQRALLPDLSVRSEFRFLAENLLRNYPESLDFDHDLLISILIW